MVLASPTFQTRCAQFICISLEALINENHLSSNDTRLSPSGVPISHDGHRFITHLIPSLRLHFSHTLIKASRVWEGPLSSTHSSWLNCLLQKITTDVTTSSSTREVEIIKAELEEKQLKVRSCIVDFNDNQHEVYHQCSEKSDICVHAYLHWYYTCIPEFSSKYMIIKIGPYFHFCLWVICQEL